MPGQIIPITDIAKAGVVIDTPSVSLPPNVFSNVQNIRFHDNAIKKMEGERSIIVSGIPETVWVYIAWWPHPDLAPDDGYYVIVTRAGGFDRLYLVQASNKTVLGPKHTTGSDLDQNPKWQHTLFGGSRTIIMNNGITTPVYLTDVANNFLQLPGWDSYLVDENVTTLTWDGFSVTDQGISLGQDLDLSNSDAQISLENIVMGETYIVSIDPMDGAGPTVAQWHQVGAIDGAATERPAVNTSFVAEINGSDLTGDSTVEAVYRQGTQQVIMTVVPADTDFTPFTFVFTNVREGAGDPGSIDFDDATGVHYLTPAIREVDEADPTVVTQQGVLAGDTVVISVRTTPLIRVRARVIRSFGNLLVAGNLTEITRDAVPSMVRNLPGVIRTSDVAAAGTIPANWNPFSVGVNTADEFTLSSTGIVQDMAELQGVLYVYTNSSIHAIQQTNNPVLPFNIRPVTFGYGCQNVDAVVEFDGKHIVVGSNDIYVFAGHPGSISSIADARVREYFFDNLNKEYASTMFLMLNRRFDELWLCYPREVPIDTEASPTGLCDEVLVWNYRDNTWTIRRMAPFYNGVIAPQVTEADPVDIVNPNVLVPSLSAAGQSIIQADTNDYQQVTNATTGNRGPYESYVERRRLALTPEFDTETLGSIALLLSGTADIEAKVVGSSTPADESKEYPTNNTFTFDTSDDYKIDVRIQGRFLNYRVGDGVSNMDPWRLSSMQYEIMKGGSR